MPTAQKPTPARLARHLPAQLVPPDADPVALLEHLLAHPVLAKDQRHALASTCDELLATLPDPIQALRLLSHLLDRIGDRTRALFADDRLLQVLTLLSLSEAYAKVLIRHPDWIAELLPVTKEVEPDFKEWLAAAPAPDPADQEACHAAPRLLKSKAFIRILLADYLELDTFEETTRKISRLADRCLELALIGAGLQEAPLVVIAMGKWGGLELNYSSDIDLLFVAADAVDAETLARFQVQAANVVRLLDSYTADGFVFRVDNRLRPEGKSGALVRTLSQYEAYYQRYARDWEFQALVKARLGGGDQAVGEAFLRLTRPLVFYPRDDSEEVLRSVRTMKGKIEAALRRRHTDTGNVKLGQGGIRDIEFIVQFLQLHHGQDNRELQNTGTLATLKRLRAHRLLSAGDYDTMRDAYVFLRRLEHYLQITHERAVRQLPSDPRLLAILAHKLRLPVRDLRQRYETAIARTRSIFRDVFDMTILVLERKGRVRELCPELDTSLLDHHFSRLETDYFLTFSSEEIAEHLRLIARLDDDHLCEMTSTMQPDRCRRVTIVAFDYLGEFAKICGLFSAYGQSILSGESFTYANDRGDQARDTFWKRPRKHWHRRPTRHKQILARRKIVCVCEVIPDRQHLAQPFSWRDVQRDLEEMLQLLKEERVQEANERITLKVMQALHLDQLGGQQPRPLLPVAFTIDNEDDATYTILEITSRDQFMFLFEFTNALSTRNYYIGKVEIQTRGGQAHDRLFITTQDGRKIVQNRHLRELRMTLTLIKQFAGFLPYAPNPHQALRQFGQLVDTVLDSESDGDVPIIGQPEVMESLAKVLGASAFLWQDFLRLQHENLLPLLEDASKLDRPVTIPVLEERLRQHLAKYDSFDDRAACLNRFKDREMFRIDLRHLTQRVRQFTHFCRELSAVADVVMAEALRMGLEAARSKHDCESPGQVCLLALGKWGGREIGYGSDIELIIVWEAEDDPAAVTWYTTAAQAIANLIRSKAEGFFELDFRLRPGGRQGALATPFSRFCQYFSADGGCHPFERQALLRLRPVAGDDALAARVMAHATDFVFGPTPFDLDRIAQLRRRQQAELVSFGTINAKFSPGGLVDVEYFVQIQQILHGHDQTVRSPNTYEAAEALHAAGYLDDTTYEQVTAGYRCLRAVINALRIVRGHAKDLVIPDRDSTEFAYLVRRLRNFEHLPADADPWAFIKGHMQRVHDLFQSLAEPT